MEQTKEKLKTGDIILSKVYIDNCYINPIYMKNYFNEKYHLSKEKIEKKLVESKDWAFVVQSNDGVKITVNGNTLFANDINKYLKFDYSNYKIDGNIFNIFEYGFYLSYKDFDLITEPLCHCCNSYCKQQCLYNLYAVDNKGKKVDVKAKFKTW